MSNFLIFSSRGIFSSPAGGGGGVGALYFFKKKTYYYPFIFWGPLGALKKKPNPNLCTPLIKKFIRFFFYSGVSNGDFSILFLAF